MAGSNYIRKAPKAMIKACDAEYTGIAPREPLSRVEVDQDSRLRSQVEQAASICQRAVDGMLEHEVPYCRAKRLYFTELAYWLFLLRRSDEAVIFLDRFHDDEGKVVADDYLRNDMKQLREFMVNDAARLIAERGRCELCDATDIPLERIDSGEGACSECVEDFEPDLFVVPAFDLTYGHARVQSRHRIREAAEEAKRSREEAERRSYGVVIPEEGFRAHLGLPASATNEQVVRAAATAGCLPVHDVDFITVVDRPKGARWASIHIDVPYGTALKLRPVPDDGSCATAVVVERPDGEVLEHLREHVAMDISCIAVHLVQGFGFTATVAGYQEYDRVEGVKIRIRPIRCLGDAERHSLETTKAFLSVVSPEELPPEIELDDSPIDFTKVVAFDLETWKLLPADAEPRDHFPLGLSCCGAGRCDVTGAQVGVIDMDIWFARDGDDMSIEDRTGQFVASHVVDQLLEMTDNGYTIVSWNGCGFDFRVLAAESGRHHDCVQLAANHVDMMFQFLCVKGFPVSLDAAAEASLGSRKRPGIEPHAIPEAWRDGRYDEVVEYLKQDITLTAKLAWIGLRAERLAWVTRSGNEAVAELGTWRRVHQCLDVPLPDTSWMTEPIGRGEFYEWFGTPDPIDPDRPE